MRKSFLTSGLIWLSFNLSISSKAASYFVSNSEEYHKVSQNLNPGDSIILKKGLWTDFVILFAAEGTAEAPVSLVAEEAGKVLISGESALLLSGSYLYVSGLSFVNGRTPKEAVISFRNAWPGRVANYSRVTNCRIDNFGLKDRWDSDNYVALWGKHNRVDHNYFGDKKNLGVTLVVYLKGEENWPNHHVIDYNHFGPRARMGSNGGETIRFGVSGTSLNSSFTVLENNLFEHCNGETEIVSIKSSDNIIRNNLFFESEGSLVLRHGNRNRVEGNVFIGNFKPYTGGIRLVNNGHQITNNLLVGLEGDGFRAPLSIMCGLENSPLNRYEPVRDVTIEGNVWMACSNGWDIGVPFTRNDGEGDFVLPSDVEIKNNVVWQNHDKPLINYITGKAALMWKNNLTNRTMGYDNEFVKEPLDIHQVMNVVVPKTKASFALNKQHLQSASQRTFGPDYKSVTGESVLSKTVLVAPGLNTINEALNNAAHSDELTLVLLNGSDYTLDAPVVLNAKVKIIASSWITGARVHPAFATAAEDHFFPVIKPAEQFNGDALFVIEGQADVHMKGLAISGVHSDLPSQLLYGFVTADASNYGDYQVQLEGMYFNGFSRDSSAVFKGRAQTFARRIEVIHSLIEGCRAGFVFDEETKDDGRYNIEEMSVLNTSFRNNQGALISIYRGGMDESTFGPFLYIDNSEFIGNRGRAGQSLFDLTGVQVVKVNNSHFHNNQDYDRLMHLKGLKNSISDSSIDAKDRITLENSATMENMQIIGKRGKNSLKSGLVKYAL